MDSLEQKPARNYTLHSYETAQLQKDTWIQMEDPFPIITLRGRPSMDGSEGTRNAEMRASCNSGRGGAEGKNSTSKMVLGLLSLDQAELAKLRELAQATGEVRCPKLAKRIISSDKYHY